MFSKSELERYSRHLVLPEIGLEGQEKLKKAKVLIIGMGGLGSPLGLYLSAAGVGKLGLVDYDTVSMSNLHRQVLFNIHDIGKPKALIAEQKLKLLNQDIDIQSYNLQLTTDNCFDIFEDYDIIADGSDNFSTRYLVNDACVLLGKPNVYGSILRFEGQVSCYSPDLRGGLRLDHPMNKTDDLRARLGGHGNPINETHDSQLTDNGNSPCPCYRCLYPEPPSPGSVPSCEEGGVLGVLPGLIGSIQANEVIKLIIGKGEVLTGRLLMVDSLNMKFRELKFERNRDCPVCGDAPVITELQNYEEFCGINQTRERIEFSKSPIGGTPSLQNSKESQATELAPLLEIKTMEQNNHEISPQQLKQKLDNKEKFFLLDVREPFEKQISDIGGVLIPMNSLPSHLGELNKEDEIIVYCRSGSRSLYAAEWLRSQGYNAKNLSGGINAWSNEIDHSVAKY